MPKDDVKHYHMNLYKTDISHAPRSILAYPRVTWYTCTFIVEKHIKVKMCENTKPRDKILSNKQQIIIIILHRQTKIGLDPWVTSFMKTKVYENLSFVSV
jgi:hypothetical protein